MKTKYLNKLIEIDNKFINFLDFNLVRNPKLKQIGSAKLLVLTNI